MTDNTKLLAELARVKAFFQLRAICTALEIPTAAPTTPTRVRGESESAALARLGREGV